METFLKRIYKWGEVTQKEVDDSGVGRDTLEYIRFMEFRAKKETMLSLQGWDQGLGDSPVSLLEVT